MRFSEDKFNAMLGGDLARGFAWRKSYACPCGTNPRSGAAKSSCPLCGGKGRQWNDEVVGAAGAKAMSQQRAFAMFGEFEPGDTLLTVGSDSPLYSARQFDRIRALDATVPFSEALIQGQNDRILGTVVAFERVFWLAGDGTTILEGELPTQAADGSLSWATGGPPANTPYSVSGMKWTEWYVYKDLPVDRNVGASGLPRRLPVRSFDLFRR